MNTKENTTIDEAYEKYVMTVKKSITLATDEGILKANHTDDFNYLSKDSFIRRLKIDKDFSKKWEPQIDKKDQTIQIQQELIDVLYSQVVDLSIMSKIELGDDVITEINRLRDLLK